MRHDIMFTSPKQARIDRVIADARQMRAAQLASWLRSGTARLAGVLPRFGGRIKAAA